MMMTQKSNNRVTRYLWWSFKDCGHHVAFFSERRYAVWYANLFALVSRRESVPEVIPVFRLDITEREEAPDGTLLPLPTEDYPEHARTPSAPWKTM
jgi:hypothetical protein